jgi:hypothetical protein
VIKQPKQRHSLAWFKLAEFVSRGEKERALGIYRLLSHSLDDKGIALQLEADLLNSFDDPKAFERYEDAARIFAQSGDAFKAAFIYERLLEEQPWSKRYLIALIGLYEELEDHSKCLWALARLCIWSLEQEEHAWHQMQACLVRHGTFLKPSEMHEVRGQVILWYAKNNNCTTQALYSLAKHTLDVWIVDEDSPPMTTFLTSISVLNMGLYEYLVEHSA